MHSALHHASLDRHIGKISRITSTHKHAAHLSPSSFSYYSSYPFRAPIQKGESVEVDKILHPDIKKFGKVARLLTTPATYAIRVS